MTIARRLAALLEALEALPPTQRLTVSVDVLAELERVRAIRAGAVLDLRLGDGTGPGLTWVAIGELVGQSRQVVEQWARQYPERP